MRNLCSLVTAFIFIFFLSTCGSGLCPIGANLSTCTQNGYSSGTITFGNPIVSIAPTFQGLLDTTYNATGYNFHNIGILIQEPSAITVDLAGNYYIASSITQENSVFKFLSSGPSDTTFAFFGWLALPMDGTNWTDHTLAAATKPNGSIVVSGYSDWNSLGANHCTFMQIDTSSNLDTTFGSSGVAHHTLGSTDCYGTAVVSETDNKITFVGETQDPANNRAFIARLNNDGTIDTAFGTSGSTKLAIAPNGNSKRFTALQHLVNGKFIAGGYVQTATGYRFLVARFFGNGLLDTAFGSGLGYSTIDVSGANLENRATSLIVDSSDNIYLGGYSHNGANYQFAAAKFNSNGSADTTFGTSGAALYNINAGDDRANAILLQSDGKILLGGYYTSGTQNMALVRFHSNGSLDTTFGTAGSVQFADFSGMDDRIMAFKALSTNTVLAAAYGDSNGASVLKLK
jgi:uncharacterized delta-60 repeat protein